MDIGLIIWSIISTCKYGSYKFIKTTNPCYIEIETSNISHTLSILKQYIYDTHMNIIDDTVQIYFNSSLDMFPMWKRMNYLNDISNSNTMDILPEDPYRDISIECLYY